MATTLPAINSPVSKQTTFNSYQNSMPIVQSDNGASHTKKKLTGPPQVAVRQMMNKKEVQLQERRLAARSKLPELTEWQTNQYQNTYKHTLCLEMLERGFHKSFTEIFELIKQQADRRLLAGPDSNLWNQRPLTEEHEKLDMMKQWLTEAESAMLLGDYMRVYQCHHQLAEYFQSTGDKWLSDHFYENCLRYSANVKEDSGRSAAEGHCNVGLGFEESGNLSEAANNFELCYALTKGKSDWLMDDGVAKMHSVSCNNLKRIYTSISNECRMQGDQDSSLQYLIRAYDMSKEGGDRKLFGEASYQLGVAYISNGDPETALLHLHSYLETCQALKDSEGIGKACEAIAKAHESQGHVEESIKYLHKFIHVSEESKQDHSLSLACNSLGIRFNCLGKYDQAFDNFSRAYNISRTLNDIPMLHLSRVLSGTAHAHQMLANYAQHVDLPSSRTSLARILDWKDNRGDEFDTPLPPTPAPGARDSSDNRPQERDTSEDSNADKSPELEEKPAEATPTDNPDADPSETNEQESEIKAEEMEDSQA